MLASPRPAAMRRRPPWFAATAAAVALAVPTASVALGGQSAASLSRAPLNQGAHTVSAPVGPGATIVVDVPAGSGGHPVLLHLPSGGWTTYDDADVSDAFGHRAARAAGWAVATLRYRLADHRTGVTADQQADDAAAAVAWIRREGGRYGLGDRVVATGLSAGAHLVALAAARAEPPVARPDAVVLVSGIYDFGADVVGTPFLAPHLRGALGGHPHAVASTTHLEPAFHADPGDPPVTIIHGTEDAIAPPGTAWRYAARLEAAGVPVSLRFVAGSGHRDEGIDSAVRAAVAAHTHPSATR